MNSLRDVMQNPEFLRLFSSPETLQVDRFNLMYLLMSFIECPVPGIGLGICLRYL